jgi:hypothetical protein
MLATSSVLPKPVILSANVPESISKMNLYRLKIEKVEEEDGRVTENPKSKAHNLSNAG